jgi:hypothetical protein
MTSVALTMATTDFPLASATLGRILRDRRDHIDPVHVNDDLGHHRSDRHRLHRSPQLIARTRLHVLAPFIARGEVPFKVSQGFLAM